MHFPFSGLGNDLIGEKKSVAAEGEGHSGELEEEDEEEYENMVIGFFNVRRVF